jgi:hypothetical protein
LQFEVMPVWMGFGVLTPFVGVTIVALDLVGLVTPGAGAGMGVGVGVGLEVTTGTPKFRSVQYEFQSTSLHIGLTFGF